MAVTACWGTQAPEVLRLKEESPAPEPALGASAGVAGLSGRPVPLHRCLRVDPCLAGTGPLGLSDGSTTTGWPRRGPSQGSGTHLTVKQSPGDPARGCGVQWAQKRVSTQETWVAALLTALWPGLRNASVSPSSKWTVVVLRLP